MATVRAGCGGIVHFAAGHRDHLQQGRAYRKGEFFCRESKESRERVPAGKSWSGRWWYFAWITSSACSLRLDGGDIYEPFESNEAFCLAEVSCIQFFCLFYVSCKMPAVMCREGRPLSPTEGCVVRLRVEREVLHLSLPEVETARLVRFFA